MSLKRKLDALRNLAERPGTEAEGKLAREILERLEWNRHADKPPEERAHWLAFEDYMRGIITMDEFLESMRRSVVQESAESPPYSWQCPCGNSVQAGSECRDFMAHENIQAEIRRRFKKGDVVFYNRWAYPLNCPGIVSAYVKPRPENGTFPWAWLSIRFGHLKNSRQVPVFSAKGWHLSLEPLGDEMARHMAGP